MKNIHWIALALFTVVVAVVAVWANLNFLNVAPETTSTETPFTNDQTTSDATLATESTANTDVAQSETGLNTNDNSENTENSANGSGTNSDNASDNSSNSTANNDNVEVSIGRGSWETDKNVPPFLVMKTVFEDWLEQEDRQEYNLFEMDIYVNSDLTRYLAVGKMFQNDVKKIPNQLKPQLNPWVKAEYQGDFGDYRIYELE